MTGVTKKAGELWKALPKGQRKKYEALYKQAREAYAKSMAEYTPPARAEVMTPQIGVKRKAGRGKGVKAAQLPSVPIDDDKILQAQHQQLGYARQVHVERRLFPEWLDGAVVNAAREPPGQGAYACGRALLFLPLMPSLKTCVEPSREMRPSKCATAICIKKMCHRRLRQPWGHKTWRTSSRG